MQGECIKETRYTLNLVLSEDEFEMVKAVLTRLTRYTIGNIMAIQRDKDFLIDSDIDKAYNIYKKFSNINQI